jgi:flavodoxin
MKATTMNGNNPKCLIAYFSRPGNNYVNGSIVNLPVGNTEIVAKMIQEMTRGDLFHIEAVHAYPVDYTETTDMAKKELQTKARPKITGRVENINAYEVILLGYPNWWGTMPMPVYAFLEEYNFSEKTLAPFCTHEGSGLGHSVADIRKMCPKSTIPDGLAIRGGEVKNARDEIAIWLQDIGVTAKK